MVALVSLALAFAFALGLTVFPPAAHAKFNDTTDYFPAAQEIGSYGAPILGSQLPDGTYKVGARGTSRMCILYTNPEDAEARDSKEQAIINVSNGNITALFYISKAYTHLYMGTQEQAAAATNADGTDASAYIAGDPDEDYVPHLFIISIPALNEPITISTYSGGDHGIEQGKWYTRQFVFTMTDDELQAAISGEPIEETQSTASSDSADKESEGDSGTTSTEGIQETVSVWHKGSNEGLTFTFKREEGDENTFSLFQDALVDGQTLPTSAYTAQQGSLILTLQPAYLETLNTGSHYLEATFADGVSVTAKFIVEEATGKTEATGGIRGLLLNGVRAKEDSSLEELAEEVEAVEPEQPKQQLPLQPILLTGGIVAAFAAGIGTRTALFSHDYEKGNENIGDVGETGEGSSENGH